MAEETTQEQPNAAEVAEQTPPSGDKSTTSPTKKKRAPKARPPLKVTPETEQWLEAQLGQILTLTKDAEQRYYEMVEACKKVSEFTGIKLGKILRHVLPQRVNQTESYDRLEAFIKRHTEQLRRELASNYVKVRREEVLKQMDPEQKMLLGLE